MPASEPDPAPWPLESREPVADLRLFRPRWDVRRNPRTGAAHRCLVLETRDWVNVVARTDDGLFVVVRQFRFGVERVTTEIPGGVIDAGETPLAAAVRELREETGHEAARWTALGAVEPNPAFHDNRCHHFLAEGARRVGAQRLDPGEDIAVEAWTEERLRAAVRSGEVSHSLVLAALCRVLDLRP